MKVGRIFIFIYVVLVGSNIGSTQTLDYVSGFGSEPDRISGPWGMAYDASGNLYVVENKENRIAKFNPSGQRVATIGSYGSGDGQLDFPTDVAIDASGNIWVTDYSNHRIQQFSSAGVFKSKFGAFGSTDGLFNRPVSIAVDSKGTLWISDQMNYKVKNFNMNGTLIKVVGGIGSTVGKFINPAGITIGVNDTIYVADQGNNRIQSFTSDGVFVTTFGTQGVANGQFYGPSDITRDASGNLYVVDQTINRVQKFSSKGVYVAKIGGTSFGNSNSQFAQPYGIVFDNNGSVIVADYSNNRIQKLSTALAYQSTIGVGSAEDGQLLNPLGVWVDASGNIFTTEGSPNSIGDNNRVQCFSSAYVFKFKFGTFGTGNSNFKVAKKIAVSSTGVVYVCDSINKKVKYFTNSGSDLTYSGALGVIANPTYVHIDTKSGNIYVTDPTSEGFAIFNSTNTFQKSVGTSGHGDGKFNNPFGITTDASGNIYVTDIDNSNNYIQKFDKNGSFLLRFGSKGSGNGQFINPTAIAVDSKGNIYVCDRGNKRIQIFNAAGTYIGQSKGDAAENFIRPMDIFIDKNDRLYVTDITLNKVKVFSTTGVVTSVDDALLTSDDIQFGPNPASEQITVFGQDIVSLSLIDLLGNTVACENGSSINVSHLESGVYLLEILKTDRKLTKRVIVK